jgi:hypothetical protein
VIWVGRQVKFGKTEIDRGAAGVGWPAVAGVSGNVSNSVRRAESRNSFNL